MRRVRTLVAFVLAAIILGAAGTFLYVRLADMPKEIRPDYVPRQTLLTDVVNADWLKNAALPLVPISSGSFLMGNGDARPVHRVNITCAFHMSATEITQAQFRDVLHESPSLVKGDNLPVENVSWRNATGFCRKLTKLESLRGNLPVGMEYRLPTEAEWEYCCRAGGSGEFSSGDDQKLLGAFAWSKENSEGKTHPVGTKKPNAWGLYDMHGNVSEYCFDWFGGYPPGAQEQTDPFCRANSGFRVLRGGSCITPEVDCRSAARSKLNPEEGGPSVGFRVVLAERVASPTPKVLTMAALVPIKPGAFMMGSNMGDENEKPVHRVNITRAFYMSTTKVTQSQYRAVMNECPEDYKGDDTPVVVVTWLEAVELCRKLTEEERRK
ncbi:MAG: SUMF1/EgtB/PvdO family nonheme iron enzyme, partial [Candidatus Brocadiia bacterium]